MTAPHPSALSNEGVDDNDLMQVETMETQKLQVGDESFCWSHRSSGSRSSPAPDNELDVDWQFEDAGLPQFSSVRSNDEQLPETVPIPPQMQILQVESATRIVAKGIDVSETCSTARRSSPYNLDETGDPWQFGEEESESSQSAVEEDDNPAASEPARSNPVEKPPSPKSANPENKTYNTRPKRNVSYAIDAESSDEDCSEEQYIPSAQHPSQDAAPQHQQQVWPKNNGADNPSKKALSKKRRSPRRDPKPDNPVDQNHKKRRKQRAKTPLPFDDTTQTIRPKPPATPPVSTKRSRKCRMTKVPALKKLPLENERDKQRINPTSKTIRAANALPEVNTEHEPLEIPSSPHNESSSSQQSSPRSAINEATALQFVEIQEASSVDDSAHSTKLTSPCVSESPRSSPDRHVVTRPPETRLPQVSGLSPVKEIGNSTASIPGSQRPSFGDLAALMSRRASRNDGDVGRRLQEVHGRVQLHLERKERDVNAIAATYRKNGAGCVDRILARFSEEYQELSHKLQDDRKIFIKSINNARKILRDGAKDRQRAIKEIDRNATKRQQASLTEVRRLGDLAEGIRNRIMQNGILAKE